MSLVRVALTRYWLTSSEMGVWDRAVSAAEMAGLHPRTPRSGRQKPLSRWQRLKITSKCK